MLESSTGSNQIDSSSDYSGLKSAPSQTTNLSESRNLYRPKIFESPPKSEITAAVTARQACVQRGLLAFAESLRLRPLASDSR